MSNFLGDQLSQRTGILGLRLWEIIALGVGVFTVLILFLLSLKLNALARSKSKKQQLPSYSFNMSIPAVSKDIKEVVNHTHADTHVVQQPPLYRLPSSVGIGINVDLDACGTENVLQKIPPTLVVRGHSLSTVDILDDEKEVVTFAYGGDTQLESKFRSVRSKTRPKLAKDEVHSSLESNTRAQKNARLHADDYASAITATEAGAGGESGDSSTLSIDQQWPGWGQRYSVEELEKATSHFAERNIVGKGGYGIVYRGLLPDASVVAVKHLLNVSRDQAEKEFRVEVEAIGRVRHKNLVGLLGYCAEGPHRMLVYEYVDNGNLDQWLHGPLGRSKPISWNVRMKIVLGTAKGLAYLHEDLEPKVVHRDVKSSNILLDSSWNAKVSDFGLAKLLGAGMSHVTTRVMGTFGYVAPEYASTGLLTESSDVYSFGVLMMEVVTGRDPVDYSRPAGEMNLVEWTKRMVGNKRWEEVVDPRLAEKPSGRALKRALLVALRCVDPDALHRPRMGHVVYMLEADDHTFHHVCKNSQGRGIAGSESFGQVNEPGG